MCWLLGNHSKAIGLLNRYWQHQHPVRADLLCFVEKTETLFLTSAECQALRSIIYLDAKHPTGKVDMFSNIGAVATDLHERNRFMDVAADAVSLIARASAVATAFDAGVRKIIPIVAASPEFPLREDGSGKSVHWLKGGIFLSVPQYESLARMNMAFNAVHELGHQVLMAYQDGDSVVKRVDEPVYSTIRKVNRPAIMSFHALVATYYMLYFAHEVRNDISLNESERSFLRTKTNSLLNDFADGVFALRNVELTDLGILLLNEMIIFFETARTAA